jgi:hypothetical protein
LGIATIIFILSLNDSYPRRLQSSGMTLYSSLAWY